MKQIITFLISVVTIPVLFAQMKEDNIIIENKTDKYSYKNTSKKIWNHLPNRICDK
jgi:hypothetical protein